MQLSGEYTFDAPQALVWKALQDPQVLGSVMPGGKGFEEVAPNEYAGVLSVKVGPVNGTFNGKLRLADVIPPESYSISVDGSGPQGYVNGQGGIRLTAQGEQTHMTYQGEARVGGRIASVGQRLIDASAKSIVRQSLEGLNTYLKTQVAGGQQPVAIGQPGEEAGDTPAPGTTPDTGAGGDIAVNPLPLTPYPLPESNAPTYTPPSQTSFALNVAADVARELIPPPLRPLLVGAGALLAGLLLWRLFR